MSLETSNVVAPQKSSMEESGSKAEPVFQWSRCMMGCILQPDKEVVLLSCFHAICSEKCVATFVSECQSGSSFACKTCGKLVTREQLSRKIVPEEEFSKKVSLVVPLPICDNCVFDRPALKYCPECPACLCEKCAELHPQTRITQKHVLHPNLDEYKAKELAKLEEEQTKCRTHKDGQLTYTCCTCKVKICKKCLIAHKGHATFHMAKEKEKLSCDVTEAKDFLEKCDKAGTELEKKREEIRNKEWNNAMAEMSKMFAAVMKNLLLRKEELQREAKYAFKQKLTSLAVKLECTKMSKSATEKFIQVAEYILDNMDESATVNFSRHSKDFLEEVSDLRTKLTKNFDEFVDKDWHFEVNDSAHQQIQDCLLTLCKTEYKHQPPIKVVLTRQNETGGTSSSKQNEKRKSSGVGVGEGNSGGDEETDKKRLKGKYAVKSTTKGSLTNLPARATYSRQDKGTQFKAAGGGGSAPQNRRTSTESTASKSETELSLADKSEDVRIGTRRTRSKTPISALNSSGDTSGRRTRSKTPTSKSKSPRRGQSSGSPAHTTRSKTPTSPVQSPGASKDKEPELSSPRKTRTSLRAARMTVPDVEGEVESVTVDEALDNLAQEFSSEGDAQSDSPVRVKAERRDNSENQSGSNKAGGSGKKGKKRKGLNWSPSSKKRKTKVTDDKGPSAEPEAEDDDSERRDSIAGSSGSNGSETELGKRERKRKSFGPGFVETEKCFKRKPEETEADASTRKSESTEASEALPGSSLSKRRKSESSENSEATHESSSLVGGKSVAAGSESIDVKMPRLDKETDDWTGGGRDVDESDLPNLQNGHEFNGSEVSSSSEQRPGTSKEKPGSADDSSSVNRRDSSSSKASHQSTKSNNRPGTKRRQGQGDIESEIAVLSQITFEEAPHSSIENPPEMCDYPVQGVAKMRLEQTAEDDSEDYCCVCLDGGEEVIVCCDYCPKVFHTKCHMPMLESVPDDKWRCNYESTKETVEELISTYPSDDDEKLSESNPKNYLLACKFLMEVFKIPESPTMRWIFPRRYYKKFGKVPFHLKYIKERLCTGTPGYFSSPEEMLRACKQMLAQALFTYKTDDDNRPHAVACFDKFLVIVEEYYPEHRKMFDEIKKWNRDDPLDRFYKDLDS